MFLKEYPRTNIELWQPNRKTYVVFDYFSLDLMHANAALYFFAVLTIASCLVCVASSDFSAASALRRRNYQQFPQCCNFSV